MVLGFGGSKDEKKQGGRIPSDEVSRLASRGATEDEIIDRLKDEGYSNTQINRALNQVLKFKVSGTGGEARQARTGGRGGGEEQEEQEFIAPPPDEVSDRDTAQRPQYDPFAEFEQQPEAPVWEMTGEEEIELEELIEEIIDEKWEDVRSKLKDFENKRDEFTEKIDAVQERIDSLEEKHEEEKEKLEGKVDKTYDHIENIETRIGSVEKAFKEFLPSLTENVRSLSGIVDQLRQNTGTRGRQPPSNYPSQTGGAQRTPDQNYSPSAELPTSRDENKEKKGEDKGPSTLE